MVSRVIGTGSKAAAIESFLSYRTRPGKGYNSMCSNSSISGLHLGEDWTHNTKAAQKTQKLKSSYDPCYCSSPFLQMG